ncbi:MAG: restriction endonuclease subunit S [Deltaproteobacteria bacterium]|nr:restriction endonuclease subunit S [Deltaproteobacteria bacterium]MBW2027124.1 restriction endonuclease subunit S [Deltaproteobacteria bacterium]
MGGEIAFRDVAQLVRDVVQPDEVAKVPYIGLEHIEQESLRLNGWGTSSDVNSAKFRFRKGDILFGKLRPYFRKVVRAPFDGICSTDIWVVRAREGCDQGYLFYWMASYDFVDFASKGSEGTRMPRAKWEHVERFTRPRLSLKEQRAIARILSTLDDKIELNHRMNRTLEAIARAIFKSWFVDFDPVVVNAIKAGNPIPDKFAERAAHYRENPDALGLPERILRLFPDCFQESELGPIPEGWEVTTIGTEFNLTMGQSPPGSTYNEKGEGFPFFQGRRDFGFRYPSNRVYCTAPKRIAHAGDTLVSVRAPVGDINMAYETCCIGRGVAAVRHKSRSRSYTYYAMRALGERLKTYEAEGTVFGAINRKQFENLPSIAPQAHVVSQFEELVYPIDENIRSFEEEARILSRLRDTLLPKLISGELRVPDVEKILEGVE